MFQKSVRVVVDNFFFCLNILLVFESAVGFDGVEVIISMILIPAFLGQSNKLHL